MIKNLDRRRHSRVGADGVIRWHSRGMHGRCRLLNLSPRGAAIMLEGAKGPPVGHDITLSMQLVGGLEWVIAAHARVLRLSRLPNGRTRVVVERSMADQAPA